MRKPWMHLTVTLLTFLGILGLFLLANGNTPVLDPSAPLPDDLADRGYALFGQPLDDDRSYVFTLRAGTRQPSLTLVLAAMRPFHVTLDGVQLYEYSEQMPYSRVHQIPLGELEAGTYRLKIHTSSGQRWIKGLLTTPERANGYQTTAGIIALLSIGMHLMMILNSLFLFLNKTSERYLLLQTGIGTISLVSAFFTSDLGQMPFNDGTYVIIQHFINGTSAPLWVFFCILIAGYTVPPRRGRLVYPLLGAVILLNTCLYRFSQPLLLELLMFPLFLLGLILLSLARARGQTGTPLLVCYAVRFALSYYNRATNWGLLPNSELLVYLYTPSWAICSCCWPVRWRSTAVSRASSSSRNGWSGNWNKPMPIWTLSLKNGPASSGRSRGKSTTCCSTPTMTCAARGDARTCCMRPRRRMRSAWISSRRSWISSAA